MPRFSLLTLLALVGIAGVLLSLVRTLAAAVASTAPGDVQLFGWMVVMAAVVLAAGAATVYEHA